MRPTPSERLFANVRRLETEDMSLGERRRIADAVIRRVLKITHGRPKVIEEIAASAMGRGRRTERDDCVRAARDFGSEMDRAQINEAVGVADAIAQRLAERK